MATPYALTPSPTTTTEGGQVTFTITRSGDKPSETIYFSARSDGTATWGEGDFSATSGIIPLNMPAHFAHIVHAHALAEKHLPAHRRCGCLGEGKSNSASATP